MFRVPANDGYTAMLGRAVYNFAYYEWIVIWTIDRLEPGFVDQYSQHPRGVTSGIVANAFTGAVEAASHLPSDLKASLANEASRFMLLVDERNRLIHAHPYTAEGGAQQLGYSGRLPRAEWEPQDVENVALQFDEAAVALNDLFHRLQPRQDVPSSTPS